MSSRNAHYIYIIILLVYANHDYRSVLSNIRWKFLVVDEGHRLKNMECRLIKELKQYKTEHRQDCQ